MTEQIKNKRDELKTISKHMQMAVKLGIYQTVDEGLIDMYKQAGHKEIHSFKKWFELGYCVKRGEKALLLWGEPRKGSQPKETPGETKDELSFYPLAYVFSQLQVQPLVTPHLAR